MGLSRGITKDGVGKYYVTRNGAVAHITKAGRKIHPVVPVMAVVYDDNPEHSLPAISRQTFTASGWYHSSTTMRVGLDLIAGPFGTKVQAVGYAALQGDMVYED